MIPQPSRSRLIAFALLTALLLAAGSGRGQAAPEPVEIEAPFAIGPIRADTTRNYVYLVDATYNRLLAINMATGVQDYAASIEDGTTTGEIAISVDGTTLYLAENQEDKILVFALPSLTPKPSITLGFPPTSIAIGTGGRLYAGGSSGIGNPIYEISTSNGSILQTFGTNEEYYYSPTLRTNAAGTNLYATDGYSDIYMYGVSGAQASAPIAYPSPADNFADFAPDETNSRIYVVSGGVYGVSVINTTTDNDSTVWRLTGPYGTGIAYNSQSTVVYGASGSPYDGDIREFSRSDGAPLADYVVSTDSNAIVRGGIATTANGNVLYVRASLGYETPPPYDLGLISTLGQGVTLVATLTQTIDLPTVVPGHAGDTVTLAGSSSSGLALTYTVVSGPGTIDGNVLTLTGVGSVIITASQAGNAVFKPASTANQSVTVLKTSQTIANFAAIADRALGSPAFTVAAPFASSGLPVHLSVKSGPATLVGNIVSLTGAGTVVLAADQPGDANYAAAPEVTVSFNVTKAGQTISALATIPTKTFGSAPFPVTVPHASSNLPIALSIQSGPAIISANIITLTGAGTVVVAADQAGNANYEAAPTVTTQFTALGSAQTIMPFKAIPSRAYSPVPFTIVLPTASSGLAVNVEVTSGPATLSGDSITLTGVGTVLLTATQGGNNGYSAARPVTTSFVVKAAPQTLTPLLPITGKTFGTTPFAITPPVSSAGLPVTVSVKSGPATIADNMVTLTGVGTVVLTATAAGNGEYLAAVPLTTTFAVGKEVQAISALETISNLAFTKTPLMLTAPEATSGLAVQLKVKSGPAKLVGTSLSLTGIGTVVLAADQPGNAEFAPAPEVTSTFAVTKNSQTIASFANLPNPTFGAAPYAITLPTATSGLPVVVKIVSGPAAIAGDKITLKGGGTVTLEATQAGNADFAAAPVVTAQFTVDPEAQTIHAFAPLKNVASGAKPFVITAPVASSKLPVTLSILSGPATLSGTKVTVTGTGLVTVAADQAGSASYQAAPEVTATFTVTP